MLIFLKSRFTFNIFIINHHFMSFFLFLIPFFAVFFYQVRELTLKNNYITAHIAKYIFALLSNAICYS